MTSSYSVNRNMTFSLSLGRGYEDHPRIRFKTLKAEKTNLVK